MTELDDGNGGLLDSFKVPCDNLGKLMCFALIRSSGTKCLHPVTPRRNGFYKTTPGPCWAAPLIGKTAQCPAMFPSKTA